MKNKIVLITGSSIGIGRETAYKFSAEKCKVIITYYKDKKEAEMTGKKCKELGASDVLVVHLDVMDNKSIQEAVKKIVTKFKKIDILINNAGVLRSSSVKEHSFEEIERQVRTNLEGLIKMTNQCLPHVKEMIITIASGAGKTAYAGLATYCATKFGVRGFTQALAQETNLAVYCVNPGMTQTRMTNYRGVPPEKVAEIILNTAKGKYKVDSTRDVDVWDYL